MPSHPNKNLPMRFSCRHHACIKSGIQKKVVGHTSTCARGVDGLKNQQIYVLPADPQLVGKAEQVMERCDQGNLNQLPEDDPGRPTIVSASPNSSVHETFEIEHAPTILDKLDPLDFQVAIKRAVKKYCKQHGIKPGNFKIVEDAFRLRLTYPLNSSLQHIIPETLKKALRDWAMECTFDKFTNEVLDSLRHHAFKKLVKDMYDRVKTRKYVALCRGHTDAWAHQGLYHPDTKKVLTFSLSSAKPAYVLVFYTDLFKPWGQELAQGVQVYDGESLVMEGAAGQTCCHIVFGPVGSICIRVRTFLVPQ